MKLRLGVLDTSYELEIQAIIKDAFAVQPWNDRWDDIDVFHLYIRDIIGNTNSLALGLFDQEELIGLSLGRLKHWFDGIEYCIDDLCVKSAYQGKGIGSRWLQMIKAHAQSNGYKEISLRTNRTAPAYRFYLKNGFQELDECVWLSMKCD